MALITRRATRPEVSRNVRTWNRFGRRLRWLTVFDILRGFDTFKEMVSNSSHSQILNSPAQKGFHRTVTNNDQFPQSTIRPTEDATFVHRNENYHLRWPSRGRKFISKLTGLGSTEQSTMSSFKSQSERTTKTYIHTLFSDRPMSNVRIFPALDPPRSSSSRRRHAELLLRTNTEWGTQAVVRAER